MKVYKFYMLLNDGVIEYYLEVMFRFIELFRYFFVLEGFV